MRPDHSSSKPIAFCQMVQVSEPGSATIMQLVANSPKTDTKCHQLPSLHSLSCVLFMLCMKCFSLFGPLLLVHVRNLQYSPTALGVSDEQCHSSLARVVSGQLL